MAFNLDTKNSNLSYARIINKLNITDVEMLYDQVFKRKPQLWESKFLMSYVSSHESSLKILIEKIKNPDVRKKIQQDYLKTQGFSFPDENSAFKKIDRHLIYFDANDRILFELFAPDELYEKSTVNLIKEQFKKGMNVINVGANVGYLTLFSARAVGSEGKVFAFEPHPKNVEFLKKNVSINNYDNIQVIQKAVSDKTGKTTLLDNISSVWHSLGSKERSGFRRIEIETTTIDDFLQENKTKIDFLIVDAEGSETNIIQGMKNTIAENPNLKIIAEYNPLTLEFVGSSGEKLLDKINELGFSIYLIDENKNDIKPITKNKLLKKFPVYTFTNLYLTRE